MSFEEISRVLGRYFLYLAAILLLPLGVAILYEFFLEKTIYFPISVSVAFLVTMGVCLVCGMMFRYWGRRSHRALYRKESILLVVIIWFLTAAVGALPFVMTKTIQNPMDAYFEAMSGLTTTGATILYPKQYALETGIEIPATVSHPVDPQIVYTFYGTIAPLRDPVTKQIVKTGIEALGKPLLFWRSFMQWLGGMGIVVLFIAVLPALAMGGKFLFENEVSGLSKEGMTPRIKETASLLWKIYLGLTVLQVILLKMTAMPFFDAVTLSFATLSTGGFTVTNEGLLTYPSLTTYWIIAFFMIAGGINFTLYFHGLRGKFYRLYEPEFLLYLVILAIGCLLMTFHLWDVPRLATGDHYSFSDALKRGSFMAISSQTSTGFSISTVDAWPSVCQLLMVILMFIGGMSGSTTGGIKVIRCFIVLRVIKNKIESLFRPEVVRSLKVGKLDISPKTAITVITFCGIVVLLVTLGVYLLVLDHQDPFTAFGIIGSMINNSGLALGGIGISGSLAFLSPLSKITCILWMVLGRLEYLSILVLLVPAFWKKP